MNVHLPETLKQFQKRAKELLSAGCVKDVEFSGETYQVLVKDPESKKEVWTFLQFDKRNQLKDSFCACQEDEESEEEISTSSNGCVHLAAAFLRIFNGFQDPLHVRFQDSLWNQLCTLYANRMGTDADQLHNKKASEFFLESIGGKVVFFIEAKNPTMLSYLKSIFFERRRETEETSLKFSNLPVEELILWREGRPSFQLKYELSFWNDLAKWMMQQQELKQHYEIEFEYSPQDIPNHIFLHFDDLEVQFYLSQANLPLIIPSLTKVKSPLSVHDDQLEVIQSITYQKENASLHIELKEKTPKTKALPKEPQHGGVAIGRWLYVAKKGFYAKDQHDLLKEPVIKSALINHTINRHLSILQRFLVGASINPTPVHASYTLSFDEKWNLQIKAYLLEPGDLSSPYSKYFGGWAYLNDDGFYLLEGMQFPSVEKTIADEDVSNFVTQNRAWLNTQSGFHTHLSSVESQLTYSLSVNNRLTFTSRIDFKDSSSQGKDFGSWVYLSGQGFYSKISSALGPLRSGLSVNGEQIPLFIRMNYEELLLVPGFFSSVCPVLRSGLRVELNDKDQIEVTPEYELLDEYVSKPLKLFEDFVYVEGEGFHEMPIDSRLPERFRHRMALENDAITLFLEYELAALKNYAVHVDPRLLKPLSLILHADSIRKNEVEGRKFYELKLHYTSERANIPLSQVWTAISQKKRFLYSSGGLLDLQEERFNWLKVIGKGRIDRRSNTITLSTLELIRLNAFENIQHDELDSKKLLEELTEFRTPEEPNLIYLKSKLWPYQIKGVHWLWFLYHHGLSGLLCDDMGLGKTHQAMALLAAISHHHHSKKHQGSYKYLIVCPTSVMYHWQDKLHKFLPHLHVTMFYGAKRTLDKFKTHYDILLTSYGIWRNENEWLSQYEFEVAIFDEIQIAKNHNSLVHASLLNCHAHMRLGLTGTPIENHLRELKALFDIALPTYMPGEKDYREYFIKPIEKERDIKKRELLSRFIKPFILRRRKEDVLLDLPEKLEEVAHCALLEDQQQLYREALNKSKGNIIQQLQDSANPIPYIHIFTLLMHLKQICNHPAVYLKDPQNYKKYQSGKWNLYTELLNEARASQQKVVVFTQYLAMLDIMEAHLLENNIPYASIRGSTTNRWEEVSRFQEDPNCEVFLGSLNAAGLGIDLTAASVVIHYDRWWNAARENQATDRVHRLGQRRGVQVFKLVTKGTFEEKIDSLIFKKGKLMEDIIGVDDQEILKQFDRHELINLLQFVEKKEPPLEEINDSM